MMKFNIPPELVASFDQVTALNEAHRRFEALRAENAESLRSATSDLQQATEAAAAAELELVLAVDAGEVARAVAGAVGQLEPRSATDDTLKEKTAHHDAAVALKEELRLRVERMERIDRGLGGKIEEIGPQLDEIGAAAASAWADFRKQQVAVVAAMLVELSGKVAEVQEYGFAIGQAFGGRDLADQMEKIFLPHPHWYPHRTLIGHGRLMTAADTSKDLSTSWTDTPAAEVHREIARLRRVLAPVIERGMKAAAEIAARRQSVEAEAERLAEKQRQIEARTAAAAAWKPPAATWKPNSWTVREPGSTPPQQAAAPWYSTGNPPPGGYGGDERPGGRS